MNIENLNSVTKSVYSSNNQELLDEHKELFNLSSNEWAGFKQWNEQGRKVKKGAKGCKIYMICDKKMEVEHKDANTGEKNDVTVKRKVAKSLYVFNKDHTEAVEQAA